MTKVYVQAALKAAEAKLARKTAISKATVINELLAAVEVAKSQLDGGTMIRAWREISLMLGHYKPEEKSYVLNAEDKSLQARYDALSDAELLAIVEGRAAA